MEEEKKINKKNEEEYKKIKKNDTGAFVKFFSNLVWISALIYAIVIVVLGMITTAQTGNKIVLTGLFILVAKGIGIVITSLFIRDILMMFYEIHFMIVRKEK